MFDKAFGRFRRAAFYSIGGVAGVLLVVILVNRYDPPLAPEVVAATQTPPEVVPDAENGYFGHYGLGIAEGEDAHEFGVRLLAASAHGGQADKRAEYEALGRKATAVRWRGGEPGDWCVAPHDDCLAGYAQHRAEIEKLAGKNPLRLARYRALYRYQHFYEPVRYRINPALWPDFARSEHATVLALIALKALDGKAEEAMRELLMDTAYWRRVLAGSGLLVSKMVAAGNVTRNFALASEILAQNSRRAGLADLFAELARPLSSDEISLKNAFWGEFQLLHNTIQDDDLRPDDYAGQRLLYWGFFKKNSTSNLLYRYFARLAPLADAPADRLETAAANLAGDPYEIAGIARAGMAHNPVGKLPLLDYAKRSPSWITQYGGRIHNLDGVRRLLHLQLEIYRNGVADKYIEAYLQKSPSELLDPYRNAPFRWDAIKRELWFDGIETKRGEGEAKRLRIGIRLRHSPVDKS